MATTHPTSDPAAEQCGCGHTHTGVCPHCGPMFCPQPVPADIAAPIYLPGPNLGLGYTKAVLLGVTGAALGAATALLTLWADTHQLNLAAWITPLIGAAGLAALAWLVIDTLRQLAQARRLSTQHAGEHAYACTCFACEVERLVPVWHAEWRRQQETES